MLTNPFARLDDKALEDSLLERALREKENACDIILHLVVVKERKLYVPAGYDSLFSYCAGRLGFSKSTAYRRKVVVDKVREFPELIERLKDGRLQLCAAAVIAPHLKRETASELLCAVEGLSHREAEAFIVREWQKEPIDLETSAGFAEKGGLGLEAFIGQEFGVTAAQEFTATAATATPSAAASPSVAAAPSSAATAASSSAAAMPASAMASAASSSAPAVEASAPAAKHKPRTVVRPLSKDASRLSITVSDKTLSHLKRLNEILGGRSDDDVLCRAFEKLLDQVAPERRHAKRQKAAAAKAKAKTKAASPKKNPAPKKPKPDLSRTRRGSLADRDAVMVEGGHQCSYKAKDGTRCQARVFIEIDHARPWALGGLSTQENERPMCNAHNSYLSEQTFGPRPKKSFNVESTRSPHH
ncbi:MAG TPA: hypothetical protein VHK86_01345 [Nitrososphaera sp.]|nr:hypothetical protein [Nitrososphaera sp.]